MSENIYLDNSATTWPKPETVYRFMDSFFRSHGVNPGRSGHLLAVEAEEMIVETRRMLAEFFGFSGNPERVVFSQNATDSLNTALFGLLEPGDHLVITRVEHNAVLRPANHLERDGGVSVTRIAADGQGYVDPDDIRRAIRPETRVVAVNHASNVLGSVQDLEAIGRVVRETDALLVVDSSQSAGVLPIDVEALGIDVLAFTGHKGLFGPMGIGGMVVGQDIAIRPRRVGGTGVNSFAPFQPEEYPHCLEAGTIALPGVAGLNAAQKWFAETGRDKAGSAGADMSHAAACRAALAYIEATELRHRDRLVAGLAAIDGIRIYGPGGNRPRVSTLSFNIDGIEAGTVGQFLDADHNICARAGLHCAPLIHEDQGTMATKGAVRFSPGYFNTDGEIDATINAVATVARDLAA